MTDLERFDDFIAHSSQSCVSYAIGGFLPGRQILSGTDAINLHFGDDGSLYSISVKQQDVLEGLVAMKLTEEGRQTLAQIYDLYATGMNIEQIAEHLKMEIEHIQFLTTLDALSQPKSD